MTHSLALLLALSLLGAPALLAGGSAATAQAIDPIDLPPPAAPEPINPALFGAPSSFPKGRLAYIENITREAVQRNLPPAVADAVAMVESAYNPGAIGGVGEIGMMQVLPSTAQLLGFRGTLAELAVPETNIRYGVIYLAEAWRLAGGDLCRTLMKYRAGHREERMSALSVAYCIRARQHLAAIGSPLASAPVPEAVAIAGFTPRFGRAGRVRGVRMARGAAPIRRTIWLAHDARFKAIQSKIDTSALSIMR